MPTRPLSLADRTARVCRAAARAGWLAVGGGLASLPLVAIVAPRCQLASAMELLPRAEQHAQVPGIWAGRFTAAGLKLPRMTDGYVCLIAPVR